MISCNIFTYDVSVQVLGKSDITINDMRELLRIVSKSKGEQRTYVKVYHFEHPLSRLLSPSFINETIRFGQLSKVVDAGVELVLFIDHDGDLLD